MGPPLVEERGDALAPTAINLGCDQLGEFGSDVCHRRFRSA